MLFKKERQGTVTEEVVLQALRQIIDPDLHRDIVSLGMIKDLTIEPRGDGSAVAFTFELTTPACPVRDRFKSQAEEVVSAIPGVTAVAVTMSANVRSAAPHRNQGQVELPGVKNVIAVASGKGGVGKSTVASNLSVALARSGARVGLLDADAYGPSVPAMMGAGGGVHAENNRLLPREAHGVRLMSLGFMTEDGRPVVWRGPMVGQAVRQMLGDVIWGDLDYLLVDLPPGTGDASITLAQSIPLSGVVVVTTPQDVALGIATKALTMFRNLQVPILGIVENMSYFECPGCHERHHIFSHGGGQEAGTALNVPFLGEVPLDIAIRERGDAGAPEPGPAFEDIARRLAAQVSIRNSLSIPLMVR